MITLCDIRGLFYWNSCQLARKSNVICESDFCVIRLESNESNLKTTALFLLFPFLH
ncbi:hypothetical protein HMPREF9065_01224 [Aggregatibacter sp. oral taxon 458 str. W10330]|nr:hypothetical protein HMPREF9065_01224 [Aggregatibacter sp. oral taxon 458 str. W10330]